MALLSPQEVRALSEPSALRSWLALLGDWTLVTAIFAANLLYPHPLLVLVSVVLIARTQIALIILMHDAAHRRLFRSVRANDWIGQWLTGSPLFLSLRIYREKHLLHHRNPLGPEDPDLPLTGGYPVSKASLLRKLKRDALGISYFKTARYFFQPLPGGDPTAAERSKRFVLASSLVVNLLLLLVLSYWGGAWIYFVLWLLPLITITQVLLRLRGIAEHSAFTPQENQLLTTRTVVNVWQTFFLAPHSVSFHLEHHAYPSIPFHRLREAHHLMTKRDGYPVGNMHQSYASVLKELIQSGLRTS